MKILYVIPFFSPEFGGSVLSTVKMAKDIRKRGIDVDFITSDYKIDHNLVKEMNDCDITVNIFKTKINIASFYITPELKPWIKNNINNYDIIHLNNFRTYQNIIISKVAMKNQVPFILQARGSLARVMGKKLLKYMFDIVWGYSIVKRASRGYAFSNVEKKQYLDMGMKVNKIIIVPNYINIEEYEKIYERVKNMDYSELDKYKDKKIILFVGRLHKIKGLGLLVESIKELVKIRDDIHVVIVGPDFGYLSTLKKKIKKYGLESFFSILGPKYGDEKFLIYKKSDIFVICSEYETFPNTMFEAAFFGNIVVSTDRCMVSDIVEKIGITTKHDKDSLKQGFKLAFNTSINFFKIKNIIIHYNNFNIINTIINNYYNIINS